MSADKLSSDRELMHALLCVIRVMDGRNDVDDPEIFRASMPSLAALFRDGEQIITTREAVARALAMVEAE